MADAPDVLLLIGFILGLVGILGDLRRVERAGMAFLVAGFAVYAPVQALAGKWGGMAVAIIGLAACAAWFARQAVRR